MDFWHKMQILVGYSFCMNRKKKEGEKSVIEFTSCMHSNLFHFSMQLAWFGITSLLAGSVGQIGIKIFMKSNFSDFMRKFQNMERYPFISFKTMVLLMFGARDTSEYQTH